MNYLKSPYKFDENGHTIEEGDDLSKAPPIHTITETFSEVKVTPESSTQSKYNKE